LRTLRQCLIDTELARLRAIARLWGLEITVQRPLEIASELNEALTDPAQAAEIWQALPDSQRAALSALVQAGGHMPVAAFTRRFGEIRPMGPGRLERESPWRNPASPAEGLWFRGLIFEGFAEEANETFPVFFIPSELQAALPAKPGPWDGTLKLEQADPPAVSLAGDRALFDDLTSALIFLHNRVVRPRAGSPADWPDKSLQALLVEMRDRDPARLEFILHLIIGLGWARVSEERRLRLVPEPVIHWLQAAAPESYQTLVEGWRELDEWRELWRLTTLEPDETGTWKNDPRLARAALLRYLEGLEPGRWVRIEAFVVAVKQQDPDFQRPGGDYETWYVRDGSTGAYLKGFDSWDRVEGALLRALLLGPAFWLGLVELGEVEKGAPPELFRVRPSTAKTEPAPPPEVHKDLTIAMPLGRRYERFQLARVADLARVDDLYLYRLTPSALERARAQRIDLEKILSFLDGLTMVPLPEGVRAVLTRWDERSTEVWLERTVILRVTDEPLLQQIVQNPRTRRFIRRVIGPTAALVVEEEWPQLLADLAEMGLLAELVGI
jgi:hypothetical protein